jgi:hypothetical protein
MKMTKNKSGELMIAEEKGLQGVKVFRVCESDAIAAYSLEEAKNFYKEQTGVKDEELYADHEVEVIPLETKFWNDEKMTHKRTLGEMVEEHWDGEPQFAISWDI